MPAKILLEPPKAVPHQRVGPNEPAARSTHRLLDPHKNCGLAPLRGFSAGAPPPKKPNVRARPGPLLEASKVFSSNRCRCLTHWSPVRAGCSAWSFAGTEACPTRHRALQNGSGQTTRAAGSDRAQCIDAGFQTVSGNRGWPPISRGAIGTHSRKRMDVVPARERGGRNARPTLVVSHDCAS